MDKLSRESWGYFNQTRSEYIFPVSRKAMLSENPYQASQIVDRQDESSHELSAKNYQKLSINVRAVLIFALTGLAINWFIFFIVQLPWIVPADSDLGSAQSKIAGAGGILFCVCCASICLPAGVAGQATSSLIITCVLLIISIGCGLNLYPMSAVWNYPYRLSMHVLQCGILIVWARHCLRRHM